MDMIFLRGLKLGARLVYSMMAMFLRCYLYCCRVNYDGRFVADINANSLEHANLLGQALG